MMYGPNNVTFLNGHSPAPSDLPPHPGLAVWCTGLSASGKTTLCRALETTLLSQKFKTVVIDGDELRKHLSRDLGFSKQDRDEQVRRISLLALPLVEQGAIVLIGAISPYRSARLEARQRLGNFIEVFVNAPLHICIARDPKHLYAAALQGEIESFTGISDPYEPPFKPEVECKTDIETTEESKTKILLAIYTALQHIHEEAKSPVTH